LHNIQWTRTRKQRETTEKSRGAGKQGSRGTEEQWSMGAEGQGEAEQRRKEET